MEKINEKTTRTYSGIGNNQRNRTWGAANTTLLRTDVGHGYEDFLGNNLARKSSPSTRYVSNKVCQVAKRPKLNPKKLSDFMWAWGQYLDHEIDLTPDAGGDKVPIAVPENDPVMQEPEIDFKRSKNETSPMGIMQARQQINVISAYIDASNVYGSDTHRAETLRTKKGGKLKTSNKNLLPLNKDGFENAPNKDDQSMFLAGDIRANEVSILTAMHTLFVREHNRRCDQITSKHHDLSDEKIYQRARRYVGALEQVITYEEFLPALLGKKALSEYKGYNDQVNAGVSNLFSTACYRLGHAMLSETVRVDNKKKSLSLRDIFFKPEWIKKFGIEPFISGLAKQRMKNIDVQIVDSLRSFLFQENGKGLDLAALNMQRGRDHGLPDYNTCRTRLGLEQKMKFRDITNAKTARALEDAYGGNIDAIDPWVGGLAEPHVNNGNVGELIFTVIKSQFERFRDGDRFWYENDQVLLSELKEVGENLDDIRTRTLSDVISDNTNLKLQPNVFKIPKVRRS